MNIAINDKYSLMSDKYNYWLVEYKDIKEGKAKGEKREVVVCGYHKDVEGLMLSFAEKKIKQSEANTIKQALEEIAQAEKECKQIITKLSKNAKRVLNEIKVQE